ncbi:MAG: hypothetical protein U9N73_08495 [Candidatus Auribacterota bacterium]|nr:hypothetical protein [Candidatus Auribacterota bacterium]
MINVSVIRDRIYNKFKENGFSITLTHKSGEYNPVTDTEGGEINYSTYCMQENFEDDVYGDEIRVNDFKLLVPAIDDSGNEISLYSNDTATRTDGTNILIYRVGKVAPNEEIIMFSLFCRE